MENDFEIKRGNIDWILRQYWRKAFETHRPWMQTTSGLTPQSSISVQPPIRKACASKGSKPAALQTSLHLESQLFLWEVPSHRWNLDVSNTKRGALLGTFLLAFLWCLRAGTGVEGSSISVIDILAPVVPVVLDQGMLKEAYSMPVMIFLYWITVDFVACWAGLKSVRLGIQSSLCRYYPELTT